MFALAESLAAGLRVVLDRYVYGAAGLISQVTVADTYYYLPDGLGSTMVTTNSAGNVANAYTYDVFGAPRSQSGAQANEFQFAGEQVDGSTGLQYLRARYYDFEVGRFISRDTMATVPGWNDNPYVYVSSRPTAWVDPLGLAWVDVDSPGSDRGSDGWIWVPFIPSPPGVDDINITPADGWSAWAEARRQQDGTVRYRVCEAPIGGGPKTCDSNEGYSPAELLERLTKIAAIAASLVGEYVSVGGHRYRISGHAADQMASRGISKGRLQQALRTSGKEFRYRDPSTGQCTSGFFSPSENLFIAVRGGEVITAFSPSSPTYIARLRAAKC